jgi:hypothetical protein
MNKRILDCTGSDFEKMSAEDLKLSIRLAEGRTILAQSANGTGFGLVDGVTNPEISAAFGADMIMLNGYCLDEKSPRYGVKTYNAYEGEMVTFRVKDLKKWIRLPMGIYLECVKDPLDPSRKPLTLGRSATEENFHKVVDEGADFLILGGNPKMNTKIEDILEATRVAGKTVKGKVLIFSGKWEDGVYEKVLGDPLAQKPAKEFIDALIDAGVDVINFPSPGSRQGITTDMIRELVEYVHKKSPETMTMSFIDGSVEGADIDTIRLIALESRETGADIHAIGDAGLSGMTVPENIFQLSLTAKGRRLTYKRLAYKNR